MNEFFLNITGNGDAVRCFFCGGGLSSWESEDDPWVEHAHWFPECLYLSQCKGQDFIQYVREMVRAQELKNGDLREQEISQARTEKDAILESSAECTLHEEVITRNSVQQAVAQSYNDIPATIAGNRMSETFNKEKSKTQRENNRDTTSNCSNKTFETSSKQSYTQPANDNFMCKEEDSAKSQCLESELSSLQKENKALRDMTTCKICMDNEINIVFLPCGHMAACSECSPAMRLCPVCRAKVKGAVRAYF